MGVALEDLVVDADHCTVLCRLNLSLVWGPEWCDMVKAGSRRMENSSCSQDRLLSARLIFLWIIWTGADSGYREDMENSRWL